MKDSTSKETEEKEKHVKREKNSTGHGIASFFQKTEVDQVATEGAKVHDEVKAAELKANQFKPKAAIVQKVRNPGLQVVDPPAFHAVRATTTDVGFLDRLKIREFVLKCALTPHFPYL